MEEPSTTGEPPIGAARFLVTLGLHAACFAAIATRLLDRSIVIPAYLVLMAGAVVACNGLEWSRLAPYLKERYPAELEKLMTQTGYGYNSLRGLRFAFAREPGDDRVLKRIRRHLRRVWIEGLSLPLVMAVVIVAAVTISKG